MPGTHRLDSHSLVFAQIEAAKVLSVSLNYSQIQQKIRGIISFKVIAKTNLHYLIF